MIQIDVAMPTKESSGVIRETLNQLAAAEEAADVEISQFVIVDDVSGDQTRSLARECAVEHGWDPTIVSEAATLPVARNLAIGLVEADWFLFLDDDVRVDESYLATLLNARAPLVGAVQGRKTSRTESPSDWVHRRSRRGGTHATLLRAEALGESRIPEDLDILHDEYLRHVVEERGYLWVFNHQARFSHANQGRHPIGWREGVEGGKYGLSQFHYLALNVPFSAATGRNPLPHVKRAAGWVVGRLSSEIDGETTTTTAPTPEGNMEVDL